MTTNNALRAVADLAEIDLAEAAQTKRHHPLFDEEIQIEEELINLKEAIDLYHAAAPSLKDYPSMRRHLLRERRNILKHCMGLIIRMGHGRKRERGYGQLLPGEAIAKLIQLVVEDAVRAGYDIDRRTLDVLRPHLRWSQRLAVLDGTGRSKNGLGALRRLVTI